MHTIVTRTLIRTYWYNNFSSHAHNCPIECGLWRYVYIQHYLWLLRHDALNFACKHCIFRYVRISCDYVLV